MKLKAAWDALHLLNEGVFGQTVIMPLLHEHGILAQVAGYHTELIKFLLRSTSRKKTWIIFSRRWKRYWRVFRTFAAAPGGRSENSLKARPPNSSVEFGSRAAACIGTPTRRVAVHWSTRFVCRKTLPVRASTPVDAAVAAGTATSPRGRAGKIARPGDPQIKLGSTPIGAGSAANARGLVQTPQSKVPRPIFRLRPGLISRGTSD